MPRFEDRILPLTVDIMRLWGRMTGRATLGGCPVPAINSLLAATAVHCKLTFVTRNVRDVEALQVTTINPWDD